MGNTGRIKALSLALIVAAGIIGIDAACSATPGPSEQSTASSIPCALYYPAVPGPVDV